MLKAFLLLEAPRMPQSGRRAVLVTRVADCMTWDDGEREKLEDTMLSQAVSRRLIDFFARRATQLEAEEQALEQAAGAQIYVR